MYRSIYHSIFKGHPELDNDGVAGVQSNYGGPPPAGGQQQAGNYTIFNIHFLLAALIHFAKTISTYWITYF